MEEVISEDLPKKDQRTTASTATDTDTSLHLSLARRFGVENPSNEEEQKLKEIWNHARTLTDSESIQDVMWEVMHLQGTLGAPRLGESSLDKMYRWARLKRQQKQVENELRNI